MSKKIKERKHEGKFRKFTVSPYGSHKSFVKKYYDDGTCLCNDGVHEYVTQTSNLDNGLVDPARMKVLNSVPLEDYEDS